MVCVRLRVALEISMTGLASAPRRSPTHNARLRSRAGEISIESREGLFSSLCSLLSYCTLALSCLPTKRRWRRRREGEGAYRGLDEG